MSQKGILREMGGASGFIQTVTGDVGGAVGPDGVNNVNVVGGVGMTTSGVPATSTITFNATGGGLTWTREAGAAVALINNHGFINTNAGLTVFTMPAGANVGDMLAITGEGAGGWTIAQNAAQSIQYGNISTTVGAVGTLSSTNQWDTVHFICRVANLSWSVVHTIGVLQVV